MEVMESLERVVEVLDGQGPQIAGDFYFWVRCYMEYAHDTMSFNDYLRQTYLEQALEVEKGS